MREVKVTNDVYMPDQPPAIMQHFAFAHLPDELKNVSRQFFVVAEHLCASLPDNAERAVALRKLLEAKDAAVRAKREG